MHKITTAFVVGAAGLSLLLSACGGEAKPTAAKSDAPAGGAAASVTTLTMQDIKYDKAALTGTKGQALTINLTNQGALEHDFTIDKIDGKATVDGKDATSATAAVHAAVKSKGTAKVEITPNAAGTFEFYCTVAGHKEAGMKGTLTVN